MSKITRTKQTGQAWETTEDTGGGGGGSQDLATTLALGNDANALQIVNLADPINPQDAVTLVTLDPLFALTVGDVLSQGNDAGNFQIKDVADGTDPQDAVALHQLTDLAPDLETVLTQGSDGGGNPISGITTFAAETAGFDGGDGSAPPIHATVVSSPAFIGVAGDVFGMTVNTNGVALTADPNDGTSVVSIQRGSQAVYIDTDGIHMNGLPTSDPGVVGVLWQDVDIVKVSLGP